MGEKPQLLSHQPKTEIAGPAQTRFAASMVAGSTAQRLDKILNRDLFTAVEKQDLNRIRELVAKGANVDGGTGYYGNRPTTLFTAITADKNEKKYATLALLLELGASPNLANEREFMESFPLCSTAKDGDKEAVKLLLDYKANPDNRDYGGYTALMKASEVGHDEIVEMLLTAGANPNLETDSARETALSMAVRKGHANIVKLLLQHGADPNSKVGMSLQKESILDIALENGRYDVARVLIENGAKPSERFIAQIVKVEGPNASTFVKYTGSCMFTGSSGLDELGELLESKGYALPKVMRLVDIGREG